MLRIARSRVARLIVQAGFAAAALTVTALTVRHYATGGWPLAGANSWLVAAAGVLFFLAFALKGAGWRRLLRKGERQGSHGLAAANAAAAVTGLALPGRFDDVVRIAVARRFSTRAGLGALCLSLVVVGLIDSAALAPLASVAAGVSNVSAGIQAALAVVAAAGVAAAALVLALPRIARSPRVGRFRAGRWLGGHATPPGDSTRAMGDRLRIVDRARTRGLRPARRARPGTLVAARAPVRLGLSRRIGACRSAPPVRRRRREPVRPCSRSPACPRRRRSRSRSPRRRSSCSRAQRSSWPSRSGRRAAVSFPRASARWLMPHAPRLAGGTDTAQDRPACP